MLKLNFAKKIMATLISICFLAGCGTKQADTSVSRDGVISEPPQSVTKEEAVKEIISSIDDALAEIKPLSKEEKQAFLTEFGQAIESGDQTKVNESFFGEGNQPHSYDMDLKYPFEDISGFKCKTLKTTVDDKGTAIITLDVTASGKTGMPEGESEYVVEFALGNDSAYKRGVVTMILPYEKNISQENKAICLINKFRSYVTTDTFADVKSLSSTGLTAYLFVVSDTEGMTMTGEKLSETAKTYLALDDFTPHNSSDFAMIQYDKEQNLYSMPAIDGNYTSSVGVRAISYRELDDSICEVIYEGYEDGLFIKSTYKLTYTLEKAKALDGSETYAIISCK